ncbi:Mavicyanin like [Actinidia chinensis var. chinensis]|uniref:Mavicyanin like n=1 Tax=Actinidia chinensis var. chinensis TaxID=1590841 RepID=A0A2R6R9Z9_ACTCC|nr:Mavicyanin like [Actinidia chinensis var. chinensis]
MAFTKLLLIVSILAVVLPKDTVAREFWVGDGSGWTKDFDYQAWAKDKMFYVGDKLVFKYTEGDHNVFKVNGTVFKDCTIPPPNGALTSGNDVITLMTPGKKWYICGIGNHCAEHNQKLAITVMDGTAPAPAPETDSAHGILTSGYQIFLAAAGIFVAMIVA